MYLSTSHFLFEGHLTFALYLTFEDYFLVYIFFFINLIGHRKTHTHIHPTPGCQLSVYVYFRLILTPPDHHFPTCPAKWGVILARVILLRKLIFPTEEAILLE